MQGTAMNLRLSCAIVVLLSACQNNEREKREFYGDAGAKDVAYLNKPKLLYVYEPVEIQLTLRGDASESDIRNNFENLEGQLWTSIVTVGPYLTAKLSASSELADIKSVDEIVRKYSRDVPTTWRWYITPKKIGPIPVTVELYVFEEKPDGPAKVYRAIRERWSADARGVNWLRYRLSELEPMRAALWTLAGGFVSVLGFFGLSGWKRASCRRTATRKTTKRDGRDKRDSL